MWPCVLPREHSGHGEMSLTWILLTAIKEHRTAGICILESVESKVLPLQFCPSVLSFDTWRAKAWSCSSCLQGLINDSPPPQKIPEWALSCRMLWTPPLLRSPPHLSVLPMSEFALETPTYGTNKNITGYFCMHRAGFLTPRSLG